MSDELKLEDVRVMAADAGFTRLTDEHLGELLRATKAARARRTALRSNTLLPADEPAHVFRPGTEVVR
jgi:hypothetical protein